MKQGEERRQPKPQQQHMAQQQGWSMEHKKGRLEISEQQDIGNGPADNVHQNTIIRDMQLKNTKLSVKLKERYAVLVKRKI